MTASRGDTLMHFFFRLAQGFSWKRTVTVFLAIASTSCATNSALRSGQIAEREQNYDAAVIAYTRAIQENPRDRDAQLSLERARLRAAQHHYNEGRRLSQDSQWDTALSEFQLAYELNPTMGLSLIHI